VKRTIVLLDLLRSVSFRHWRQALGLHALLVLIIATGVAAFLAIRLANRAVTKDFERFAAGLSRESLLTITRSEPPLTLADLIFIRDATSAFPLHIVPSLERVAVRFDQPNRTNTPPDPNATVRIVGIDLVAAINLVTQSQSPHENSPTELPKSLATDGSPVLAAAPLFRSLRRGEAQPRVRLLSGDTPLDFAVDGIIATPEGTPAPPDNLILMDLLRMSELFKTHDTFDRIDLFASEGARLNADVVARVLQAKDPSLLVQSPEQRGKAAESMTRGLRLNLTILSLLSLLVGVYLVFQALDAAVVRRRPEIATLRSLGVPPRLIRSAWLLEATLLGLFGGAAGVVLGRWLGNGAVQAVSQTVHSLYYANAARSVTLGITETSLAIGCAVVASLLAGWVPAKSAAETPPAQLLGSSDRPSPQGRGRFSVVMTLLCMFGAMACSQFHAIHLSDGAHIPVGGYLTALFILGAAGFCVPTGLPLLASRFRWWETKSPAILLGNTRLRHAGSRHLWAGASLLCTVAMTAAMQVLVASFAASIENWISHSLKADVFLTSRANQSATAGATLSPTLIQKIRARVGIQYADGLLLHQVGTRGEHDAFRLLGSDFLGPDSRQPLQWLGPEPTATLLGSDSSAADPEFVNAVVSEAYTVRFHTRIGDSIRCNVGGQPRKLRVVGVHSDFSDQFGTVTIPLLTLQRWLATSSLTSLALTLTSGTDPIAFADQLQQAHPELMVYTNANLREEVLRLFRQTFAVTHALEIIGLAVALGGLALTVSTLLGERRLEWDTLRIMGCPPSDLARGAAWETGMLTLFGSFLGVACGIVLGAVLIFLINFQTFGWTLMFRVPWSTLAPLAMGIAFAGALAGFLTAQRKLNHLAKCS
jgi:putative ABC transport system permease protein